MEISACPACGATDIRYERTTIDEFRIDSWRSADDRPIFVANPDLLEATSTGRVVCVNGHAHPLKVGFDLEWSE